LLLELLAEQPRHGYDLIKVLEERYGGFYRPSPGSVYPTLQLLEDKGFIIGEFVEGKRVYTITESGRQALAEQEAQRPEGRGRHRHHERGAALAPELEALRRSVEGLTAVVVQAARHGTPAQAQTIAGVLEETRRAIHRILAQSSEEEAAS
jgi:DNA-binding PadR family transcriptional regulator